MATPTVERIDLNLFERLIRWNGEVGRVVRAWPAGFLLIDKNQWPLYLFRSKRLFLPCWISLDGSVEKWIRDVGIREGDFLLLEESRIFLKSSPDCPIDLSPAHVVDLKRHLCKWLPTPLRVISWVKLLMGEMLRHGRMEGLGETIHLLTWSDRNVIPEAICRMEPCTALAAPHVLMLFHAGTTADVSRFIKAYKGLVGLGFGMTPSGDDFLVGFLAAHKFFCTPLANQINDSELIGALTTHARKTTTPVAAECLRCALAGRFSECLYDVMESLIELSSDWQAHEAVKSFLRWGSSSGTDTVAGLVFGLASLANLIESTG